MSPYLSPTFALVRFGWETAGTAGTARAHERCPLHRRIVACRGRLLYASAVPGSGFRPRYDQHVLVAE